MTREVRHRYRTRAEAKAFADGVEYVNDSALTVEWIDDTEVVLADEDGDGDAFYDHTGEA